MRKSDKLFDKLNEKLFLFVLQIIWIRSMHNKETV